MGANFTPNQEAYKHTKKLPFSCMKVLPTVFDDALSYYETLCQVTDKLNEVIEYVNSARLGTPQVVLLADNNEIDDFVDWESSSIKREDISTVLAYRVGDEVYFTLLGFKLTNPTETFVFKSSVGEMLCFEYFPLYTIDGEGYDKVVGVYKISSPNTLTIFNYDATSAYCCISGHCTILTDKNHSFDTSAESVV